MKKKKGFTLIELSIVLVIIGLIVGGILVGQDLIKAAEVRAQISQIEKYNQAVNTFRAKFSALPGDMPAATANQFGFYVGTNCNGGTLSYRDGNGLIDGYVTTLLAQTTGETALFWVDLSSANAGNLIDGQFPNSGGATPICGSSFPLSTTPGTTYIGDYLPTGKIGHGTFVYVYETNGFNWYGLSSITSITGGGGINSNGDIPVFQAYNIDRKIDDGLPATGSVLAVYISAGSNTATSNAANAATDTTTTCYNTTSNVYSLSTYANYGAGGNCALSFRFQ